MVELRIFFSRNIARLASWRDSGVWTIHNSTCRKNGQNKKMRVESISGQNMIEVEIRG